MVLTCGFRDAQFQTNSAGAKNLSQSEHSEPQAPGPEFMLMGNSMAGSVLSYSEGVALEHYSERLLTNQLLSDEAPQ